MEKRLNLVYAMHAIDGLAGALINIFIPIYFLRLGYPLSQIFIFFLANSFGIAVFFVLAGFLSNRYGLKKVLLLRLPFLFIFFYLLHNLDRLNAPILLLASINSIQVAFYWFPLHVFFTMNSKAEKIGNHVGKLFAFPKLLATLAPLIGGTISFYFGFQVLFGFAVFVYTLAASTLIFFHENKPEHFFSFKKFLLLFKKYSRFALSLSSLRINEISEAIIWPVFIYLSFNNIMAIGILGTLLSLGNISFIYFVGNISDKFEKRNIIKLGSIAMILVWLSRFYLNSEISAYLLTITAGFFLVLVTIPVNSLFYGYAKEDNAPEFIIFTEFFVNLGRIAAILLALLFIGNIKTSFLVAAASFIYFLIFKI